MRTLNLGILAHVDAGKTTLTERLLHDAGVTDTLGSVDAGTTHTDFLDLERQRGITIKAAVVSFPLGGVTINLIDTPGHPDFVAEVERTLGILDGAVLVVSAVEGVQAQTRLLMRALQRLRIPTILFVNKIDRVGAQEAALVRAIADRLSPSLVVMGTTHDLGSRHAGFVPFGPGQLDPTSLADHDEAILQALVQDARPGPTRVRSALRRQTRRALVHPIFFGSALTGAGVDSLAASLPELLPALPLDGRGPLAATVFKIDRGPSRERIAFVRLFSGTISVRQRIDGWTVTGIEVFANGDTVKRTHAVAGEIAKVRGLSSARVGDSIGEQPRQGGGALAFAPPTLASVVVVRPEDRPAVHTALTELAEQDPLIAFRQDEVRQELHLSLFGEVQKEVIQATLANEFGLDVELRESTPICIERLVGAGEGVERMPRGRSATHPFLAGVGLRIEPATIGSGVIFDSESQLGYLPASFVKAVAEGVDETLRQGLRGWAVTDCRVSLTHSRYAPRQSHAHQGFSKAMSSVGSDFRLLAPLVVVAALKRAGTVVCEPVHRYELEIPADVLPVTVPLLARVGAPLLDQRAHGTGVVLSGEIRAAAVHRLQQQIPHLTRGEAVLECVFHSYQPVHGPPPVRPRTDHNPLNRKEYLLHVLGRA